MSQWDIKLNRIRSIGVSEKLQGQPINLPEVFGLLESFSRKYLPKTLLQKPSCRVTRTEIIF